MLKEPGRRLGLLRRKTRGQRAVVGLGLGLWRFGIDGAGVRRASTVAGLCRRLGLLLLRF